MRPDPGNLKWHIVGFVLVLASTLGCEAGVATPEPTSTPMSTINVRTIWNEYENNETRANKTYKAGWLQVEMTYIDKIEDEGRVLMNMDDFGWSHIELDFKNDDDVLDLDSGQSIVAVCKLSDFQLDSWLNLKDCRFPSAEERGQTEQALEVCEHGVKMITGGSGRSSWMEERCATADEVEEGRIEDNAPSGGTP